MAENIVRLPSSYYGDPNQDRPIFNGSVFIGEPDTDPEIEINRKAVTLKQEDGTLVPITPSAQPLVTGSGGYVTYDGGSPEVLVDGNYSLKVLDSQGNQEFYFQNVLDGAPVTSNQVWVRFATVDAVIADSSLSIGDALSIESYTATNNSGVMFGKVVAGGTGVNGQGYIDLPNTLPSPLQFKLDFVNELSIAKLGAEFDGSDNTLITQNAIEAIPVGGTVLIPAQSSVYTYDTSGGLSAAVDVSKSCTFQIDGGCKSTFSAIQANPPYIFNVTADDVAFTGYGFIEGDGTYDATNAGDDDTFPGILRVTGNRFFSDIEVRKPPKVGIMLYSCDNANLSNAKYSGGEDDTHDPGDTALFAIRVYQGNNHRIHNNQFVPDDIGAGGGRVTQGCFTNSTQGLSFVGNTAVALHEKILYLYGDGCFIASNTARDMLITDIIRITGSDNTACNNSGVRTKGGISVYDGNSNTIMGNTFIDLTQTGIVLSVFPGYTGGMDFNVIKDNVLRADPLSVGLQDGIIVLIDLQNASGLEVKDNTSTGFQGGASRAGIRVEAVSPYAIEVEVDGNSSDNAYTLFFMTRVSKGTFRNNSGQDSDPVGGRGLLVSGSAELKISNNDFENIAVNGIGFTAGSSNCEIFNNKVRDVGSIGIGGVSSSGHSFGGNTYTSTPLLGYTTATAATSYTVPHDGVAPEAHIQLQPYNNPAGVSVVTNGYAIPGVTSPDFVVSTANGTLWAGTELFSYNVIQ